MRAILTYHSIDDSGSAISVSREGFHRHVDWLSRGAVRVLPLNVLLSHREGPAVSLTFDDGFANFASEALPLLLEHGLPATVFVVSDCVGGTNAWGGRAAQGIPTLPLMDWSQIEEAASHGIAIGAHTRTHPRLTRLAAPRMRDEVVGSKTAIERRLGRPVTAFAWPYGDLDAPSTSVVADAFPIGCTTELRLVQPGESPHLLPRVDMYYFREPGALEAWGTASFHARLWLRAQGRRVRAAFRRREVA